MAYETNATDVGATTHVVVGLFNNANDAHQAINQLRGNGFTSSQIGAAFRGRSLDRYTDRDAATSTSGAVPHESWWEKIKDAFRSDDKVEARREVDANAADPYAEGEHEYDFSDAEFQGSLAGTGIPSDRAAYLARNLQAGGAIVTVRDANRATEAEQILSANHGKVRYEDGAGSNILTGTDHRVADVSGAGMADADFDPADYRGDVVTPGLSGTDDRDTGLTETNENAIDAADSTGREVTDTGSVNRRPPATADTNAGEFDGDRVQLFGEVLRVHKERISRGEVRVRKDVVTENQTIEVPVTREELVLERVAVSPNTPASSANIGRSQEIRVPLSEDSVRVEKQPVVREEVIVGKREVSDVARVGDELRHEELRVDSDVDTPKRTAAGEDLPGDFRRRG